MKRLFGILSMLLCLTTAAMAQTAINGKVKDKRTGEALSFVNVIVTAPGSKTPVKNAMTDESGSFGIAGLKNGSYTVSVSFMGYKPYSKNITANGNRINLGTIALQEEATALKEVTVTGQRAGVKLEVDRKSFDVSQDITNAGGSASEALENIPSVEVDQDGNVSLRGDANVQVWINGRQSGLTSTNRGDILKQLPAESIERIEVIDNPSSKYSAEGSAGIINIVLKKNRKAGYYGSAAVGGNTQGGANASVNINYSSSKLDLFASLGYHHMEGKGSSESEQTNYKVNADGTRGEATSWNNYSTENKNNGNNLFSRLGGTWHVTDKDDLGLTANIMFGKHKRSSQTPYLYGNAGQTDPYRIMTRNNSSNGDMKMQNYEFNYRHTFSTTHLLDFVVGYSSWGGDNKSYYRDSTENLLSYAAELPVLGGSVAEPSGFSSYTLEPFDIENKEWEIRLDYENQITDKFKLEAGYNANLEREDTPNEQWTANNWAGIGAQFNAPYYNRFLYNLDIHALYSTFSFAFSKKFSAMAGLRSEFWKVNTKSYKWSDLTDLSKTKGQEVQRNNTFKKNFWKLFPSLFLSYQLTENQQLQLNYTRRLRRPHGDELNDFMNTSDATLVHYGNPELTPTFTNSFALNYLNQFGNHSLLFSAYYRLNTDVESHVSYQMEYEGQDRVFQTVMNVTKSSSTGIEATMKNKFFKILDLTTTVNLYQKHVDGFDFDARNPLYDAATMTADKEFVHVSDEADNNFTWNARMQASLILPWDMSIQLAGRYRSKEIEPQGYRNAMFVMQGGIRKNFLNKLLTVSLNCRDLFNTRQRESFTDAAGFTRHQKNRWMSRMVNLTVTWNFGNMRPKMQKMRHNEDGGHGHEDEGGGRYDMNMGGE